MALDTPLKDMGLKSERLLWPNKASKFEEEVSNLEEKVGLTSRSVMVLCTFLNGFRSARTCQA